MSARRWGDVIDVRPLDVAPDRRERSLVLDSWTMSWVPHTLPALTPMHAAPIVEHYLGRADQVLVAVVPGIARTVVGWVARLGPGVLGYLYVMHDYRRHGIGERLLRSVELDPRGSRWRYVFATRRMRQLCRPDPRRPERVPWKGEHGQEERRRGARGAR
jgi:GNAT superfamily N-acetyltransferase